MAIIQTTLNFLRTDLGSFSTSDMYYTTDSGQEGFWKYLGTDTSTDDNTGLTLTNPQIPSLGASRKVFKRVYDSYISVDWFGAKPDGVTDNTSAIQLAVDSVLNLKNLTSGGTLLFSHGIYNTDTIILYSTQLTNFDKINIKGRGKMSTRINGISRLNKMGFVFSELPATASMPNPLSPIQVPVFKMEGIPFGEQSASAFLNIFDLTIQGNYETGNYINEGGTEIYYIETGYTFDGIHADNQVMFELGNIEIKGCETCFIGNGCLDFHIHDFLFGGSDGPNTKESSNYGIKLTSTANMAANAARIKNGTIKFCKLNALEFTRGNLLNISDVVFELNGSNIEGYNTSAILLKRTLNDSVLNGNFVSIININSCWFEENFGYTILLEDPNTEGKIDNIIINILNSFFAYMKSTHSLGVYLGLINWPLTGNEPIISKVNILGTACKLPVFAVKALETICTGSYIETFLVNNVPPVVSNTPGFISNRNYLLNN
jgi:hypothetical protein